jgi:hypothetical protein
MEKTVQWQMNRTRGARVLKLFMVAEHCEFFASQVGDYQFFPAAGVFQALKLSRSQRLSQGPGAVRS